jgi:hypothetical protein
MGGKKRHTFGLFSRKPQGYRIASDFVAVLVGIERRPFKQWYSGIYGRPFGGRYSLTIQRLSPHLFPKLDPKTEVCGRLDTWEIYDV